MKVTCKACGKRYDYHKYGCCPECGAYNRPPHHEKVDADGSVHHISEEDFWENGSARHKSQSGKVCFETKSHAHESEEEWKQKMDPDSWDYDESDEDTADGNTEDFDSARTASWQPDREENRSSNRTYTNHGRANSGRPLLVIFALVILFIGGVFAFLSHSFHEAMEQANRPWETFVEEFSPVEEARPELSDLVEVDAIAENIVDVAYEAQVGDTFLWWDDVTQVTDYQIEYYEEGGAEVTVELYRAGSFQDTPMDMMALCYQMPNGMRIYGQVASEMWSGNHCTCTFREAYVTEETELRALFTGYNGDEFVETQVPLW